MVFKDRFEKGKNLTSPDCNPALLLRKAATLYQEKVRRSIASVARSGMLIIEV